MKGERRPYGHNLVNHEMGHAVLTALGADEATDVNIPFALIRPLQVDGRIDHTDQQHPEDLYFGYAGGWEDYQFGYTGSQWKEEFADMFVGWVYAFSSTPMGGQRTQYMQIMMTNMVQFIP